VSTDSQSFADVDGMRVLWDVQIPMDDGGEIRADVFLPREGDAFPLVFVVTTYGKNRCFWPGALSSRLLAAGTPLCLR
jgi:predicted acyl esterase